MAYDAHEADFLCILSTCRTLRRPCDRCRTSPTFAERATEFWCLLQAFPIFRLMKYLQLSLLACVFQILGMSYTSFGNQRFRFCFIFSYFTVTNIKVAGFLLSRTNKEYELMLEHSAIYQSQ